MSSSASISAAKKRRANQVQQMQPMQPMQQQMQRPPGQVPPSLANLNPAQRQQFLQQQQQQQLKMQQMQQQQMQHQQQPQGNRNQQPQTQGNRNQQPHMQEQQQSQSRLSWPAPPIYVMKQMDNLLFQQSQTIDEIKNRLNCIESGSLNSLNGTSNHVELDIKSGLMSDPEFVGGIVDNIMTNSNLSEIIEQIETVQTENRELRELLYAQQKTINEINIMLLKLMSQGLNGNNDKDNDKDKGNSKGKSKGQQDQDQEGQDQEGQEGQDQEGQDQEGQEQEGQNQEGQHPNVALEIQDK